MPPRVERQRRRHVHITTIPTQRLAVLDDVPQIAELMRSSILDIFPRYYDAHQTASVVTHIADPDLALIEDGTYFVHEADGEIVACGGWSRRNKLYTGGGDRPGDDRLLDSATEPARVHAMFVRPDWTRRGLGRAILETCEQAARAEGFTRLTLLATLPGEQLYRAFGFAGSRVIRAVCVDQRLRLPTSGSTPVASASVRRPAYRSEASVPLEIVSIPFAARLRLGGDARQTATQSH